MPRRGAVVASLTVRDVNELYDVRGSLEVLATRLAAEQCARGTSAEILREILDEAERAAALAFAHGEHSRRYTLPVVRSLLDGAPESPPRRRPEPGGPASGRGEGLAGSGASEGRPPSGGGRVLPLAAMTALWEEPGPW
ncbi:hypothetical protein [Nonomuraea sp. NPDC049607]|uniref:hypothetical protein n=1 Tax=Nonomuraea sp. NPDC049607 TaxID=3154732 RepID=UPI00344895F4